MRVTINGQTQDVGEGLNVAGLLDALEMPAQRVAVERNRRLVRRAQFEHTALEEGDSIEIVTLVGGG